MNQPYTHHDFIASGLRTVQLEGAAVNRLQQAINHDFSLACQLLLGCEGRIVVTGMGKSGHVARKIAATLASTGSPAFFVHPGEASHGDLGMITSKDVVIALSNSGSTAEVVTVLPLIKRMGVPLISMTGNPHSTLAQAANVHLDVSVESEACPLDLAPTASTTVALVMGDALAIALLEARGFTAEDFAFSHPGGALGRKLLLKVEDIMHTGERIPTVTAGTPLVDALLVMNTKGLGLTTICDEQHRLLGVFTDGDLRRALHSDVVDLRHTSIDSVMTRNGKTVSRHMLAAEALSIMEHKHITALVVADSEQRIEGIVHLHEILKAGVA
ncbi:MAG TPA: KpsF/GutQ family sugar-phosphate isomerase [Pseudomonadales bacterium]|nr:KpsF/GutQ family sugar-phosphate isomerase [Pseudomonadales bacterium]